MAPKKLPASQQKKSAQNYSKNPASRAHKNAKQRERNKLKRTIRHQLAGLEKAPIDIVIVYRGTANKYDAKLISSSLQFHKENIIKTTEKFWKTSE